MKNFKIGQEIRNIILSSNAVKNVVGTKIYPLVATQGTTFPFIVYRRNGYGPKGDKDFIFGEIVYIEIVVIATNYEESVSIANDVADVLIATNETDNIESIKITNIAEDYISDSYTQKINLEVELK